MQQPMMMQPMGMQPMGMQPMGMQPMGMQPMGMQPMGIKPPMSTGTKILYGVIVVICLLIVYYLVYGTLPFGLMGAADKAASTAGSAAGSVASAAGSVASAAGSAANPAPAQQATQAATGPSYLGCYSSGPKSHNNNRIATDHTHGITTVTGCNAAAKAAGKTYFGMSYWPGGGSKDGKNTGKANCVWASDNLDLAKLTAYTDAPGGNKDNAPGCPAAGPFTKDCISNDTVHACPINLGTDVPANSGRLGGGWVNALYKTF